MNTTTSSYPPKHLWHPTTWVLAVCLSLWGAPGQAEDPDPASRVARVSYLKGQVYTQTTDDEGWATAAINQPLTTGDQLWTDNRARAELQMGSTTLQIDANTQLELLELSDDVLQLQVTQGVVNVRVRNLSRRDTVEVDTPNAAVTAMEAGTYRIEVADNDELTVVQVREGSADVAGDNQDFTLQEDEQLTLRGDQRGSSEYDDVGRMDEFDRWAAERNQRAERVASSRYVGADVIGYEDLDDYGYWRWYNDYGYVWMPTRIVSGWAPYRYGHWSWVSPWGWTWIDDAPWGFAPFHYGRWTSISNRWCWVPGPRTARAVYAPALVAWIGTPGLSVSVSIGAQPVGWIPLGPREVYRPVYRSSHNYVVNVNLSNSLLKNDEFERGYRRQPHESNYGNRNAASVVRADALRSARPINNQLIRFGDRQLEPLATTPVARPERREPAGNQRNAITPPQPANAREVLARRQPTQPSAVNSNPSRLGKVRVIEPTANRRNSSNGGAGPNISNDGVTNGGVNRRDNDSVPRDSRRGSNRNSDVETNEAPASRSSRTITTTPSIQPDISSTPRRDQPQGRSNAPVANPAPAVPSVTPNASPQRETPVLSEPRVRNNPVRDEARSTARERNRGTDNSAPTVERGRPAAVPNNPPAPVQPSEPSRAAPAPSAPTPSTSNSERSQDNDRQQRRRGFKVEEQ